MKRARFYAFLAVVAVVGVSCSSKQKEAETKEKLLAELRLEAQSLKVNGEKVNPNLPVKSTWTLVDSQIKEQPDNIVFPYKGTVRFKIETRTRDVDGSVATDSFEKSFDYMYDPKAKKWR
jgi:hypothetical protein